MHQAEELAAGLLSEIRHMLLEAAHPEIPVPEAVEALSKNVRVHEAELRPHINLGAGDQGSSEAELIPGFVAQLVHALALRRLAVLDLMQLVPDNHVSVVGQKL